MSDLYKCPYCCHIVGAHHVCPAYPQVTPGWAPEESASNFESGAKCSEVKERFDLVCPTGLWRLAARYGEGASRWGDFNWCKGGHDPKFQRARLNHLIKHLTLYRQEGCAKEDHLAAIAWGAFALMHFEDNCKCHLAPIPGCLREGECWSEGKNHE